MSLDEGDSNVSSTQAGTNGRSYEPTAEELGFFQGVLQQLRNFDWSQHQGNYKTPETATRAHLNSLRNNHGSGWERTRQRGGNIGKPTKYPSHSQICQDPLWRDAKNLASLPDQYLPPFLQPEATLEYHRNFSRDVYDSASKCTKCGKTGSKNGVKFVEGKFVYVFEFVAVLLFSTFVSK